MKILRFVKIKGKLKLEDPRLAILNHIEIDLPAFAFVFYQDLSPGDKNSNRRQLRSYGCTFACTRIFSHKSMQIHRTESSRVMYRVERKNSKSNVFFCIAFYEDKICSRNHRLRIIIVRLKNGEKVSQSFNTACVLTAAL